MPNALERSIRKAIHLHDEKYATARFGAGNTAKAPLALPSLGPGSKRILYTIYEYEPLLDSSNMTMDDWINIAKDLRVYLFIDSLFTTLSNLFIISTEVL